MAVYRPHLYPDVPDSYNDIHHYHGVLRVAGPLAKWPSYILKLLFCAPYDQDSIVTIAAFTYGNRIKLQDMRWLQYHANPVHYRDCVDVHYRITSWYNYWNDLQHGHQRRQLRTYYDLHSRTVLNLNHEPTAATGHFNFGNIARPEYTLGIQGLDEQCARTVLDRLKLFEDWLLVEATDRAMHALRL